MRLVVAVVLALSLTAEGFEADMIVVPANPLDDIRALQDVLLVMSNGQLALKRIPFGLAE